jgi:hypothetical protein
MTGEAFEMTDTEKYAGCKWKHRGTFELAGPFVGHVFEAVSS